MRSYFGQLSCRHVTIFCAKLIKTSWFGSRKNSLKCSCNQKGTPSNSLFCNPLHIYLSTILTGVKSKTFEGCILSQGHRHNLWKRTRWQIHGGIAQRQFWNIIIFLFLIGEEDYYISKLPFIARRSCLSKIYEHDLSHVLTDDDDIEDCKEIKVKKLIMVILGSALTSKFI